jgi:hypothetical protein
MRGFTFALLAAVAVIGSTATAPKAEAQVSVNIGVAPVVAAEGVRGQDAIPQVQRLQAELGLMI